MLSMSSGLREQISNGNVLVKCVVTLDSGTTMTLQGTDVMMGGTSLSSSTSSAGSFDVGAAIIRRANVRLRNDDRRFDNTDFSDAKFVLSLGADVDGTEDWKQVGVYWVEPIETLGEIINMSGLGNMRLLEKDYSAVKTTYPATLGKIASDICSYCGITLLTTRFPNYNYVVRKRLADSNASCLEVIGWVAQVAGCFADEDEQGRLRIRWYNVDAWESDDDLDGGTFDTATTPYSDGDSADGGGFMTGGSSFDGGQFERAAYVGITAIRSITASVNDVRITGISVTAHDETTENGTLGNAGEQYLYGSDGYVLDIADNPLIEYGRASEVAALIGSNVVGMTFRPLTVQTISDPAIEAGDAIQVTDRLQHTYNTYATNIMLSTSGTASASCRAKSSSKYEQRKRRTITQIQQDNAITQVKETVESATTQKAVESAVNNLVQNDQDFATSVASSLCNYSPCASSAASSGSILGADGNYYGIGVDEDGNVVATKVPSAIEILNPEVMLTYNVGSFIYYGGLLVHLLDGEGNDFADERYTDGIIPFEELTFPVTTAPNAHDVTKDNATSIDVSSGPAIGGWTYPIELHNVAWHEEGSYRGIFEPANGAVMRVIYNTNRDLKIVLAASHSGVVGYEKSKSGKVNSTFSTYRSYTRGGMTAYYYIGSFGAFNFTWTDWYPKNVSSGPVDGLLAWAMVYGNYVLGGTVTVPVRWNSPYDGRTLETSVEITVKA